MKENRRSVFLSHASKDFNMIESLASHLEANGIPCWYAPRNIPYGQTYNTQIAIDIETVEAVLVFITENVKSSEFIQKEVDLAIRYKRTIIPVLVDGSEIPKELELYLCNIQWLNKGLFDSDEEFYDHLTAVLEEIYQGGMQPRFFQPDMKQPLVLKNSAQSFLFEISSAQLQQVKKTFVAPAGIEEAKKKLKEHNILYIHHPQHIGKYSYAISLLEDAGAKEIYEWSKEATLLNITQHALKKKIGLLAEVSGSEEFFKGLHDFHLDTYIKKLKEKEAYCIIINQNEPPSLMQPYSVRVKKPDDLKALLIKHTMNAKKEDKAKQQIVDWIDSDEGEEILPDQLYPREAKAYIDKLEKLVTGKISKKEFIESLDVNVEERVKTQFMEFKHRKNPLKEIAFYLALSIYEGNTYPLIIEKSWDLFSLLVERAGQQLVFEEELLERDEYLSFFHAHVVQEWRHTDAGGEKIDVVRFLFKEDIPVIWAYIWEQYSNYNAVLVSWLQQQLFQFNKKLDENIKFILVYLLKKDSIAVRNQVILPWANSEQPKERLFAAQILQDLSKEEDRKQLVFNLVKSWANLRNNTRLQWTSTILMGTELNISYFPQILRLLRSVYEGNGGKLAFSVQRSFESLSKTISYGPDYEKLYFRFWQEWFGHTETKKAQEVIRFAQSIFAESPEVFFSNRLKESRKFWEDLVHFSLRNSRTRKSLEGMLEAWAAYSQGDTGKIDRFASLLYKVYKIEEPHNKEFLERFIRIRVRRQQNIYGPIQERLINM